MDDDNDGPSVVATINIEGELVKLKDGSYEIILFPWNFEEAEKVFKDENLPNLIPQNPKWGEDGYLIIKLD